MNIGHVELSPSLRGAFPHRSEVRVNATLDAFVTDITRLSLSGDVSDVLFSVCFYTLPIVLCL